MGQLRVSNFTLIFLIPLILSIGIAPSLLFVDFSQEAEALKAVGPKGAKSYGSKNAGIVCGDRLCSQSAPTAQASAWNRVSQTPTVIPDDTKIMTLDEMSQTADLVLTNGKVYTVDDQRSWKQAFAVKDGKIIKVGSNEEVESLIGDETEVIDAEGQLVLPGFHDLHMHPSAISNRFAEGCSLPQSSDSPTTRSFLDAVGKCAKDNPDTEWVIGFGGPTTILDDVIAIDELDKISPNRPLFIQDETGHNGWANSQAFELAGVTKDTPDPQSSEFVKDEQGELHGKNYRAYCN